MFTKLSSLLVQDGVVSVKKVEEALQRQVIFGGSLDTILLEIGAVDEVSLCRFLHVAAGVPAADLSKLADTDLRDSGMITLETARSYGIVPIRKHGDLLHVVVKPGVGRSDFEELSYVLGLRVVPYVAPEVRVEELLHRAYGGDLEHRFEALLERLGPSPDLRAAGIPAVVLGSDEEVEIEAMPPDSGDVPAEAIALLDEEAKAPEQFGGEPAVSEQAGSPSGEGGQDGPEASGAEPVSGDQLARQAASEAQSGAADTGGAEGAASGIKSETIRGVWVPEAPAAEMPPRQSLPPEGAASSGDDAAQEGDSVSAQQEAFDDAAVPKEADTRGLTGATIPGLPVTAPVPPAEAVPVHVFQRSDTLVDVPTFEPESDWNEDEVETSPVATPWGGPTDAEVAAVQSKVAGKVPGTPISVLEPGAEAGDGGASPGEGCAGSAEQAPSGGGGAVVVSGELSASEPGLEHPGEPTEQPKVVATLGDMMEMAREARGEIHVEARSEPKGDESGPRVQVSLDVESSAVRPASVVATEPFEAVSRMQEAANRDEILELMVRAAVSRVEYSALFVVYGDRAVGRIAAGPAGLDTSLVRKVSLPLGAASLFKTVVDTGSHFYGPVADEGLNFSVLTSIDRISAPNVLVMPVRLGRRVVCLLYCDNGSQPVPPEVVGDLAVLPNSAARAFSRLILEAKKARHFEVAEQAEPVKAPAEHVPAKGKRSKDGAWEGAGDASASVSAKGTGPQPVSEKVTAVAVQAGQTPDRLSRAAIELMLDQVEQGGELAERARTVLQEGGAWVVEAILKRFPGGLTVDRHQPGAKLPPVEEHGPLLALLVDLGEDASGAIMPLLGAPDPEVRFYATYLFSELVSDDAVPLLYQRMFDEDVGIRKVARQAVLRCAQSSDLRRSVLEHLRGVLQQGVPFHRVCAAEGVTAFRDKVSVPMLVDMMGHQSSDVAEAAQEALVAITKHNFGRDQAAWWAWWQENGGRHRVEWMLDALASDDLECRFLAMQELAELAGDTFGYRFDLGHDEVGAAVARWRTWWEQVRGLLGD